MSPRTEALKRTLSIDRRAVVASLLAAATAAGSEARADAPASAAVQLPRPRLQGPVSVEQAMSARRSVRAFLPTVVTLEAVAQLLWAAQGLTDRAGRRTAPSAGALYPLVVYLAAGRVEGLEAGVCRYDPARHALVKTESRDRRAQFAAAAGQGWIGQAAAILVIATNPTRTVAKYGARAERYALIEAGHAAENVLLQAVALGLGSTDVGAFDDAKVRSVLGSPAAEQPILLLPFGRPRRQ